MRILRRRRATAISQKDAEAVQIVSKAHASESKGILEEASKKIRPSSKPSSSKLKASREAQRADEDSAEFAQFGLMTWDELEEDSEGDAGEMAAESLKYLSNPSETSRATMVISDVLGLMDDKSRMKRLPVRPQEISQAPAGPKFSLMGVSIQKPKDVKPSEMLTSPRRSIYK